jgi:hypothetical protein
LKQKKIHRLDGNHELPFVLIALSYPESLLKTAWALNKKLNINLKESEILIQAKDNTSNPFPVFCDIESSEGLYFSLISNKSSNNLLIKELPNIDFILEISGAFKKSDIMIMIKEVKLIAGIIAAIELNPEKIKRKTAFCPF